MAGAADGAADGDAARDAAARRRERMLREFQASRERDEAGAMLDAGAAAGDGARFV